MEDQVKPIERPQHGVEGDGSALPTVQPPAVTRRGTVQAPSRSDERIESLIDALGDPHHAMHQQAEEELIAIGAPAVSGLVAALQEDRPWLTSYRAAEALGQIGDGRASGPLIQALRHPNSNVRWSAVRALAEVGDTRAVWYLRQIIRNDRGKTSWGESVAAAAQAALDQMQSRSALIKLGNPAKTAILFAIMLAAVIIAFDKVGELKAELNGTGGPSAAPFVTPLIVTATPEEEGEDEEGTAVTGEEGEDEEGATGEDEESSAEEATPTGQTAVTAKAVNTGNVRDGPSTNNKVIDQLEKDQEVRVLAASDGWFQISYENKTGWVAEVILGKPSGPVPTVTPGT
jgi:uncharacterized protein YgiM (DUF1202 family)